MAAALLLEEEIPYWDFSQKSPNRDKPEAGIEFKCRMEGVQQLEQLILKGINAIAVQKAVIVLIMNQGDLHQNIGAVLRCTGQKCDALLNLVWIRNGTVIEVCDKLLLFIVDKLPIM